MNTSEGVLPGVEALTFDVFGTVVDWHGSVVRAVKAKAASAPDIKIYTDEDWSDFAKEWRNGYLTTTKLVAHGGEGSLNVDVMHRQVHTRTLRESKQGIGMIRRRHAHAMNKILDNMLSSERWASLGSAWGEEDRKELVFIWHKLDGWPDSSKGLYELKKKLVIATLSNGNVRLLADMAKHADLPWDVVFSGELLGSYKPNPKVYLGALHHLSVRPDQCAMVAAHIYDLQAAASHGMKTIYVRRPTEDLGVRESVKTKAEGGTVDVVVDGFEELAKLLGIS